MMHFLRIALHPFCFTEPSFVRAVHSGIQPSVIPAIFFPTCDGFSVTDFDMIVGWPTQTVVMLISFPG